MSYSEVIGHQSMLFDAVRNEAYAQAIRALMPPGAAVLDLGAGLGIHGLVAAAAGARAVYLVEPEPVVALARPVAQANGLGPRVHIHQDRIERLELPEPVDMLISTMTGNLLFSEDLLPLLYLARDRHLKPGGHMLPHRARLCASAVAAPALRARSWARWLDPLQGLDYSEGLRHAANSVVWWDRAIDAPVSDLAQAITLVDLDLATTQQTDCHARQTVEAQASGECNGLLVWIEIDLAEQVHSSHPAAPSTHWTPGLFPIEPALPIRAGQTLEIEVRRPRGGEWTWTVAAPAGRRRHSTFLAGMAGTEDLALRQPQARPALSEAGQRTREILEAWDAGCTNQEVMQQLMTTHGMSEAEAQALLGAALDRWAQSPAPSDASGRRK